jgi:hypothetical protein
MSTISNIKIKCKGLNLKKKKKLHKLFKTKYIENKRIRTKFDIKIKCEGMKLKKQINFINNSRPNTL